MNEPTPKNENDRVEKEMILYGLHPYRDDNGKIKRNPEPAPHLYDDDEPR